MKLKSIVNRRFWSWMFAFTVLIDGLCGVLTLGLWCPNLFYEITNWRMKAYPAPVAISLDGDETSTPPCDGCVRLLNIAGFTAERCANVVELAGHRDLAERLRYEKAELLTEAIRQVDA